MFFDKFKAFKTRILITFLSFILFISFPHKVFAGDFVDIFANTLHEWVNQKLNSNSNQQENNNYNQSNYNPNYNNLSQNQQYKQPNSSNYNNSNYNNEYQNQKYQYNNQHINQNGGVNNVQTGKNSTLNQTFNNPTPSPYVEKFYLNKSSIDAGDEVRLSWDVRNADKVRISNIGNVSPYGDKILIPKETTTYHLYADDKPLTEKTVYVKNTPDYSYFTRPIIPSWTIFDNAWKNRPAGSREYYVNTRQNLLYINVHEYEKKNPGHSCGEANKKVNIHKGQDFLIEFDIKSGNSKGSNFTIGWRHFHLGTAKERGYRLHYSNYLNGISHFRLVRDEFINGYAEEFTEISSKRLKYSHGIKLIKKGNQTNKITFVNKQGYLKLYINSKFIGKVKYKPFNITEISLDGYNQVHFKNPKILGR